MASSSSCLQGRIRRVQWLVPFPPGGAVDIYSRLLEPYFSERIGADIVVENMPGAGGSIAATKLRDSAPDGSTLGILNAPGLMAAALTGETNTPNSATDFTILGRIVQQQLVWVTASNSPLRTMDDVLSEAKKRSIVFAVSDAGSTNFVNTVIVSQLLGLDIKCLAGFLGSRETSMAVMRGEADLGSFTFESALDRIESQDLRVLLQVTEKRIAAHPSLDNAALLGGDKGLAAQRANELGRDARQAQADALTMVRFNAAGLLIAAPPKMNEELSRCLDEKLHESLTDPAFQAAAAKVNRSLDIARGAEAQAGIQGVAAEMEKFIPMIREAINKIRK